MLTRGNHKRTMEALLPLRFLEEKMIPAIAAEEPLSAPGTPHALLGSAMRFQLRHDRPTLAKGRGLGKSIFSPLPRTENDDELIPLELNLLLYVRHILQSRDRAPELLRSILLIGKLPAAHAHDKLHGVLFAEKFPGPEEEPLEIMPVRAKPEAEHLHLRLLAMRPLLLLLLLHLIEIVAHVAHLHYGGIGFRRYLNEIELLRAGSGKGIRRGQGLRRPVCAHQKHCRRGNLLIDARTLLELRIP